MSMTVSYDAERRAIERQIARLQVRLFHLSREALERKVELASPDTRQYREFCRWEILRGDQEEWLVRGECRDPEHGVLMTNYMVTEECILGVADRIALFEHLHLRVVEQFASKFPLDEP